MASARNTQNALPLRHLKHRHELVDELAEGCGR